MTWPVYMAGRDEVVVYCRVDFIKCSNATISGVIAGIGKVNWI